VATNTSYTVYNRTVTECATECINSDMKNMSVLFLEGVHGWNLTQDLLGEVDGLIIGFTGPDMKATLQGLICYVTPITTPLWVGCALLLIAALVIGLTLLSMDRAIFCFYKRGLTDIYMMDPN